MAFSSYSYVGHACTAASDIRTHWLSSQKLFLNILHPRVHTRPHPQGGVVYLCALVSPRAAEDVDSLLIMTGAHKLLITIKVVLANSRVNLYFVAKTSLQY